MRRPESFSFGVFTDAHITAVDGVSDSPFNVNSYSNTRYQAAIKMMNSLGLDFALNLGDMVHPLPQSPEYITAAKPPNGFPPQKFHPVGWKFINHSLEQIIRPLATKTGVLFC